MRESVSLGVVTSGRGRGFSPIEASTPKARCRGGGEGILALGAIFKYVLSVFVASAA